MAGRLSGLIAARPRWPYPGSALAMKVLYVNHTAQISGAEHALLALLAGLPDEISPAVACPEGPLAAAVREVGVPVFPVSGTSASLRFHPLYTPLALADM